MNYSEMTDFEINKAVAAHHLDEWYDNGICVVRCDDEDRNIFNPCNSWADAGPIIQRNKISLIWVKTEIPNRWDAGSPCHMKWATNEYHPLRAAMETFLLMREQPDAT